MAEIKIFDKRIYMISLDVSAFSYHIGCIIWTGIYLIIFSILTILFYKKYLKTRDKTLKILTIFIIILVLIGFGIIIYMYLDLISFI